MEQLEIHSRSYLVRWVNVKGDQTISWTVRPDKKSINLAIFKHPGSGIAGTPKVPSATFEAPPSPALSPADIVTDTPSAHDVSSKAVEKLKGTGLKLVQWCGTCEANRASTGKYDVTPGEDGMYALVFDNTFSKQHSKRVTLFLLTYPTISPPQTDHYIQQTQKLGAASNANSKESLNQKSELVRYPSTDLAHQAKKALAGEEENRSGDTRPRYQQDLSDDAYSKFFSGTLQKRRRRKHQGWARRYFSLDYSTSTLSYYHDRNTSSLRGAIPLSLAAIGANATTRQISIDSGAEVWHLRAPSQKDFSAWKQALEIAHAPVDPKSLGTTTRRNSFKARVSIPPVNVEDQREWTRIEDILNRVKGSRDRARTVAKDTDPKYLSPQIPQTLDIISGYSSASESPSEQSVNGYSTERSRDRRPFWKRKTSGDRPVPGAFKRSVSATPSIPTSHINTPIFPHSSGKASESRGQLSGEGMNVHEQCMSLLRDLDSIVADFNLLVHEGKQRRDPGPNSAVSRHSVESQDDEFFDAEGFNSSQLLDIHYETDEELSDRASISSSGSSTNSKIDEQYIAATARRMPYQADPSFPPKSDSLPPLPTSSVHRRDQMRPPVVSPPSLISFLRKNVGKDLSTISMPVSANEPISLLQRAAESLEYSALLDSASAAKSSAERLLFITTFAISHLSSSRVRERTVRKPFNPMLGETFELVREDCNFRFLAEKVSHHPVQLACQADSFTWSLSQSPRPSQKFWGKSVELSTEGKFRIALHNTGDHFSWIPATSFVRNIIAGEKYMEPVGSMTVVNETTGEKGVVTFKAGGMFSGRSEEVIADILNAEGSKTPLGLVGKWTSSLAVTDHDVVRQRGNPIWTAGVLTRDAAKRYGFTNFATSLNEITPLEDGKLAPTDSRLRPDQRAVENCDLETAERLKAKLETTQRQRRGIMQAKGIEWMPQWFEKLQAADGEEVWVQKQETDSYWVKRQQGDWKGVERIFDISE